MIVNIATRTHLLLESLDAYIFSMRSPVSKRKRALHPVVRVRQQLADSLARLLEQLGLQRVAKPVPSLQDYLRSTAAEKTSTSQDARRTHGQDDEEPAEIERDNEPREMHEEKSA